MNVLNVDKIIYGRLAENFKIGCFLWLNEWNEWNKRKAFFSLADMNAEAWDQASGETYVLEVENQFINLALSQQKVLPPTLP